MASPTSGRTSTASRSQRSPRSAGRSAQCRVGVVTTSEMARRDAEAGPDDPRRLVYSLPTDLPVDQLYSKKAAYDRYATSLDDVDSYLPLTHLHRFVAEGRIGAVAPRFQVIYSEYSQRKTLTVDAPEILEQMREDRRGRGGPRRGLTRLPPDRESGRAAPGRQRHPDRGLRLRARYRRALRRAALRLQRLSAGEPRRQALRPRHAARGPVPRARPSRRCDGPQHHAWSRLTCGARTTPGRTRSSARRSRSSIPRPRGRGWSARRSIEP